jgi:type I restriction enzyme S subunit
MSNQWEMVKIKYFCQTNIDAYSLSESWNFINYLDTGNITCGKIDKIQHIINEYSTG